MNTGRDYTSIFVLWAMAIFGWQLIEMKALIDRVPDWTGDTVTTISDWWEAYKYAWATPANSFGFWLGADRMRFLEINPFDLPAWFFVPVSIVGWTVIWLLPCLMVVAVIDMFFEQIVGKVKKP